MLRQSLEAAESKFKKDEGAGAAFSSSYSGVFHVEPMALAAPVEMRASEIARSFGSAR